MTSPNQLPNPEAPPTLAQALRLHAIIEAAARTQVYGRGWQPPQLSDAEALAVYHVANQPTIYGNKVGHVERRTLQPDGRFAPSMFYFVIRKGDETTTQIIQRPPIKLPRRSLAVSEDQADDITLAMMRTLSYDDQNLTFTREALSAYAAAEAAGLFAIYGPEVETLITDIATAYGVPPA